MYWKYFGVIREDAGSTNLKHLTGRKIMIEKTILFAAFAVGALATFFFIEYAHAFEFTESPEGFEEHVLEGCTNPGILEAHGGDYACVQYVPSHRYWEMSAETLHYWPTILSNGEMTCQCRDWPMGEVFREYEDIGL